MKKHIFSILKILSTAYFCLYLCTNIAFFLVPEFCMQRLIFENYINFPWTNFSNPQELGMNNVYNFYLNVDDIKVGVWHFLPPDIEYVFEKDRSISVTDHFQKYLKNTVNKPIIIVVHGNRGNRASYCIRSTSRKISELGYHVFSLDYRGFGDSEGTPYEMGVVKDLLTLIDFLKPHSNSLYLYGHSLGTGIVAHAAKIKSELNEPVSGLILEAPFLNISYAFLDFPLSRFFLYSSMMSKGVDALEHLNLYFNTDKHISKINSKILILHSEYDQVISHDNAYDLFKIAQTQRPKDYPLVELMIIDEIHQISHNRGFDHDEIFPLIKKFVG